MIIDGQYFKKHLGLLVVASAILFFAVRWACVEIHRTYYNFKRPLNFNAAIFIEARAKPGYFSDHTGDIVILNLENGQKYYLNSDGYDDDYPVLSSDRERIYFRSKRTYDDLQRRIEGIPRNSVLFALSLRDRSVTALPVNTTAEGYTGFGLITGMTTVPGDTAIIFCSSDELRIYSMKDKTVHRFHGKPDDMEFAWNMGVTPDSKFLYVNFNQKGHYNYKTYISMLSDSTNLLSFENYTHKDIQVIGYNKNCGAFYLKYRTTDSAYKDLPTEIYKFYPADKRLELFHRFDKEFDRGFFPTFMPNDTIIVGTAWAKTSELSLVSKIYHLPTGEIHTIKDNSNLRHTSYSYFWK